MQSMACRNEPFVLSRIVSPQVGDDQGTVVTAPYFFTRADDAGEAVATGSYPALRGRKVSFPLI